MPKVFMPNLPMRKHPDTREWVPSIDPTPAEKHGELVVLLTQDEVNAGLANCSQAIRKRLADSSPDDFILCTGRPALQMAIGVEWYRRHPGSPMKLLEWDARLRSYLAVEFRP